jgi:tetratricopeptide (TPR) repeat protein
MIKVQANKTVEVFCSYAHEDESWLRKLESHLSLLKRQGHIALWHDRLIVPGTDWTKSIDIHLETASVILLLVSADFLASDYCYGIEMTRALERHQRGEAQVIPILIRQVDWKHAPFAYLRVLPTNAKPLALWRNKDAGLADVSENLRRVLEGEPMTDARTTHPAPPSIWNVPYRRNPYFTGRDDLLEQLDQHFRLAGQNDTVSTRRAALTQPRAIKGLGGIGKTQIAIEYAYRSRDCERYTHTLWVNAASKESLQANFVELAKLIPAFNMKDKEKEDPHKLVEAIKHWLEQCQQPWLLIFDNADDITLIRDYLPQTGNGNILLTTRADAVGALATSVEVVTMGFIEGIQLLLRRAQRFEHASDEEVNQAGNIVVALDHFPLAIDQAGAYIEETRCSVTEYLTLYQEHRKTLLARRGTLATDYPYSVATTWELSLKQLQQTNPAAIELLQICAFLDPDGISDELIQKSAVYWPPLLQQAALDRFTLFQVVEELLKFSLVKRKESLSSSFTVHRLVQAVQRDHMEPQVQRTYAESIVRAVNQAFPSDPDKYGFEFIITNYLSQVQACYTLIEQFSFSFSEAAELLSRMVDYATKLDGVFKGTKHLNGGVSYSFLESLYRAILRIREEQLGPEHLDVASVLHDLANFYSQQGNYAEAESLYRHALRIREEQLGSEHLDVASTLHGLANTYCEQGHYQQAERLFLRVLRVQEEQLGPEHLDVAYTLNDLANVYGQQGKYAKTYSLTTRAERIEEEQSKAKYGPIKRVNTKRHIQWHTKRNSWLDYFLELKESIWPIFPNPQTKTKHSHEETQPHSSEQMSQGNQEKEPVATNQAPLHDPSNLVYLVRGKDSDRAAWHYVLIDQAELPVFLQMLETGSVDVSEYGKILYSGWGEDPPPEIVKTVKSLYPQ